MAKSDLNIGDQVSFDGVVGRVVALGPRGVMVAIARGPTHEVGYAKVTLRKKAKRRKKPSKATRAARAATGDPRVVAARAPKSARKATAPKKRKATVKRVEPLPMLDLGIEEWEPKAAPKPKRAKGKRYEERGYLTERKAGRQATRAAKPRIKKLRAKGKRKSTPTPPRDKGSRSWSQFIRKEWPLHYLNTESQRRKFDALSLPEAEFVQETFDRNQRAAGSPTAAMSFAYALEKLDGPAFKSFLKKRAKYQEVVVQSARSRAQRLGMIAESAEAMQNPATFTAKGERMYKHIRDGYTGMSRAKAKELAARTVYCRAQCTPGLVKKGFAPQGIIRKVRRGRR